MFCATCNLHYPDHLNFCRRCGKGLVHTASELALESLCCTRCGARIVRGENFCQHCGHRQNIKSEETVIGACYHCGTSWRSGWLFCKTCGLDRERALMPPVSTPASPASAPSSIVRALKDLPKMEKVQCKHCGAEAKPYSRFCEACGIGLEAADTGRLKTPPATSSLRTQLETPTSQIRSLETKADTQKTRAEVRAVSRTVPKTPPRLSQPAFPSSESKESTGKIEDIRKTIQRRKTAAMRTPNRVPTLGAIKEASQTEQPETVVTSLPRAASEPMGSPIVLPEVMQQRSSREEIQRAATIVVLSLLIVGITVWCFSLLRQRGFSSIRDQLSGRPTPVVTQKVSTAPSPEVKANASPTPSIQAQSVAAPEGMIYIPGGTFKMGRDQGGDEYEMPAHTASVEPYFIDRTEVTNEDYQVFMAKTGHRAPSHWINEKFPEGKAKFPVVNVSWNDADAYAKWANKRLPTEKEWEFAARGTDGRIFPWGKNWNQEYANVGRGKDGGVVEVGRYSAGASPFGVLDMCGNVWEWTLGRLYSYADKSKELAPGKVIRGGAYDVPPERATATYRGVIPPDKTFEKTGFRCVRDIK